MRSSIFLVPAVLLSLKMAPVCAQNEAPPQNPPAGDAPYGVATPDDNAPPPPPDAAPPDNKRDREAERAQQRENHRVQVETRLRLIMNQFGLQDETKQDALIAYLAEDEAGKTMVRDSARRLLNAVRRGATPERMRDLIGVYKGAIDADRERRAAAQKALDAKIGYSLDPRLEAVLWLFGFLGDGQPGLSLNLPTPRNPPPIPAPGVSPPHSGVVFGTLSDRGADWIEVQIAGDAHSAERYFLTTPPPDGPDGGTNGNALPLAEIVKKISLGSLIRVEWRAGERKTAEKIEIWTPPSAILGNAPQTSIPNAPKDHVAPETPPAPA